MIDDIKIIVRGKHWDIASGNVVLKDDQSGMAINLTELPHDGIVIDLSGEDDFHLKILKELDGTKKFCDKIIFIPHKRSTNVYLVEMKKSITFYENGVPKRACQQILRTLPILRYLSCMMGIHFNKKYTINKISFIILVGKQNTAKLNKQGTKVENPCTKEYQDEEFRIIFSPPDVPSGISTDAPLQIPFSMLEKV